MQSEKVNSIRVDHVTKKYNIHHRNNLGGAIRKSPVKSRI